MDFFKEELLDIRAFVFDVDGVLSMDTSPLNEEGDPVRTANVKDGFAIRNAIEFGYPIAVITGGYIERVRIRYEKLGVKYFYDNARDKVKCLQDFLKKTGIKSKNVMYMGDDLVDYQIMSAVGIPACPKDAVSDIKAISKFISSKKGGEGCVRDIIEQTLRAQKKWFNSDMLFKNAF
jgi:3-deoxy-D-manno-octulosonate 8-phosphate phosphatase (KDO 8-P phosphatase)